MVFRTGSEKETFDLGVVLAGCLKKGDVLSLSGDLGAGKTILVKGIVQALGFPKNKVVSSSFVLIREYKARMPVYHFDLYRLNDRADFLDLGYEEYLFGDGICLLEWGERASEFMPAQTVFVSFKVLGENKRNIMFSGSGKRYKEVMSRLRGARRKQGTGG